MINASFKKIAILSLILYICFLFYPIRILNQVNAEFSVTADEIAIHMLDPSDVILSNSNPNKINILKVERPLSTRSLNIRSYLISHLLPEVKTYFWHNDLHFNLPVICYKFPLSEHTEEG